MFRLLIKKIIKRIPVAGPLFLIIYKLLKRFYIFIRRKKYRTSLFDRISEMYHHVEQYQPLYNCPVQITELKRSCIDRCKAIEKALEQFGHSFRLIDIGCSLGYFCFYFAERGANVVGVDFDAKVIALDKLVSEFNRIPVKFMVREFDSIFIEEIEEGEYDVAFVLNVFHHIIHSKGLECAQKLLQKLCLKIPIVMIELATKEEDVTCTWRESLPDDFWEVFKYCENVEIEKIGEFSTHLSKAKRSLYIIKQNSIIVNGKLYKIDDITTFSHQKVGGFDRTFYFGPGVFVKKYRICEGPYRYDNIHQIIREISIFDFLGSRSKRFPVLKDIEIGSKEISVVFERLDAINLEKVLSTEKKIDQWKVFIEILKAVKELRKLGLYHNDLRTWNVMLDESAVFLVDLGLVSFEEKDNTIYGLLQILWDIHQGKAATDIVWPIEKPPSWNPEDYGSSVYELVKELLACENIDAFLSKIDVLT